MIKKVFEKTISDYKTILIFIGILLFRISLEITFNTFALRYYPKVYWKSGSFNFALLSWLLLCITFVPLYRIIKHKGNTFSGLTTFWIYLFAYVPSNLLSGIMFTDIGYSLTMFAMWFILLWLIGFGKQKNEKYNHKFLSFFEHKKYHNLYNTIFYLLIFVSLISVYIIIYQHNQFRFEFSFNDIYELREESKYAFSTAEGLVLVIIPTILIPVLLPIALKEKKYFLACILIITQILVFMIGANKFYLIVMIVGLIIYGLYSQKIFEKSAIILAVSILMANMLFYIDENVFFKDVILDIGVRRMFLTPAQISYYYYEFFQNSPYLWLCDDPLLSRLGNIGPLNGIPIADIVMFHNFGVKGTNNGTFGNAFSEFGYMCIILYPVIYALFVRVIDYFTKNLTPNMFGMISLSLATYLVNGSIAGMQFTYVLFACGCYIFYELSQIKERPNLEKKSIVQYGKKSRYL